MVAKRRDGLTIQAIDPTDGKPIDLQVDYDRIQWLRSKSKGLIIETGINMSYVLEKPLAIFQGLKQERDEKYSRGVG